MSTFDRFEQQAFVTTYIGDGIRYQLPRRQLGRARHLGWGIVSFGLFATMFMIVWMSVPILSGLGELKKGAEFGWMSIAFGCFGVFGLVPALGMLLGGIAIVGNRTRCEIEVRGGKIFVKERLLLLRLRRKRAVSDIQRLRIVSKISGDIAKEDEDDNERDEIVSWLGNVDTALIAESAGGGKFPIAIAYPRELLLQLAEDLASQVEAELNIKFPTLEQNSEVVTRSEFVSRKIEVTEESPDTDKMPVVPDQPENSIVTVERRDFGITLTIPSAGIWKGSKGLIVFAVLWNMFISIFIVVGILSLIGAIKVEGDGPAWLMLVIVLPFIAVGAGMTVAAINMGLRHASIATADDLLMVVRHSIFGKTTREWSASDLAKICCGNSGMEINNVPVKELQIIPENDKKFGCLSQLNKAELVWIAAELNQALGMSGLSAEDGR
jgi:hypothetical protein